ncbi:Aste57867_17765 [Aphanomyces stellatus]|uniref:Aste57867_17765 protein n=1 Tax=Aphanomyces stellatus TaxID=120398 RepID=A0A485L9A2_9STRA|nr:hypothetical protein As57867_017704 [Aphanomyces stellatus]VFT94511.1 Aste57867_17765 [Aphanomyces stellatus]
MSHVQNHIQIPSLKRNLSGGAVNSSSSSLSVNTSHMSMSAAASLSALASGNNGMNNSDRAPPSMQPPPPSSMPHRHDQHILSSSSHSHSSMSHAYPSSSSAHDNRYLPGPPQHPSSSSSSNPITSTPPTIQRAVTTSSAYTRQPITYALPWDPRIPVADAADGRTRVSTSSGPSLQPGASSSGARPQGNAAVAAPAQDWRMYLTIEERQAVRAKIHDAYTSTCKTYEELLQAASAIEEELLHIAAPSRLDYFKSGFEFENRVKLKREQLQGQLASMEKKATKTSSANEHRIKESPVAGESAAKKSRKQQ